MKTWGSVPNNLVPEEAFKYCVDNQVLTSDNKLQCYAVTYGPDGTGYGGYKRLSLDEIKSRGGLLHWFDGFTVVWTDVIHNPWPVGDKPFDEHPQSVKDIVYRKFAWCRQFTGTRAEVRAFTSMGLANG